MIKKPEILPVTASSELGVDLLALPASSSSTGRIEENTACAPDPLTSRPKARKPLLIALGLLVATSLLSTLKSKNK